MQVVDRADATGDWEVVRGLYAPAFARFATKQLLGYLRFPQDQLPTGPVERATLARLCTADWQRRCQLELEYVDARFELEPRERDALHLVSYLLGRFGARAPVIEDLAKLQVSEREARHRTLGDAMSRVGLTTDDLGTAGPDAIAWLERDRWPLLTFCDWVALRTLADAEASQLWLSSLAARVVDVALRVFEKTALPDRRPLVKLAASALTSTDPELGRVLVAVASPQLRGVDERLIHDAILGTAKASDDALRSAFARVLEATEDLGDYAGAAALRQSVLAILRRATQRRAGQATQAR